MTTEEPRSRPAVWPRPAALALSGEDPVDAPIYAELAPPSRFSLWDIGGALLAGLLGMMSSAFFYPVALLLLGFPATALRNIATSHYHLGRIAIIASLAGYAAIFLFLLWRGKRRGLSAREIGFAPFAGWWLLVIVGLMVGLRFVSGVFHLMLTDTDVGRSVEIAKSMLPGGFAWNAVTAFMIVVLAPLTEELFFRVVLFGSLTRFLPRIAAAVLSVVIFAALHMQYSLIGGWLALVLTGDVALLGAALMWLYLRSGSIWPSVLLHALNNGVTLAALLVFLSSNAAAIV